MKPIILPWPPWQLSGHTGVHWRAKATLTKKHREWARLATLEAGVRAPETGDILLRVLFIPPDRRSDRTNFANRLKPAFDGIADALGVNDRRFVPSYHFAEPEKPGRVEITLCAIPWTQADETHLSAAERYVARAA